MQSLSFKQRYLYKFNNLDVEWENDIFMSQSIGNYINTQNNIPM